MYLYLSLHLPYVPIIEFEVTVMWAEYASSVLTWVKNIRIRIRIRFVWFVTIVDVSVLESLRQQYQWQWAISECDTSDVKRVICFNMLDHSVMILDSGDDGDDGEDAEIMSRCLVVCYYATILLYYILLYNYIWSCLLVRNYRFFELWTMNEYVTRPVSRCSAVLCCIGVWLVRREPLHQCWNWHG